MAKGRNAKGQFEPGHELEGRPLLFKDAEALEARIAEYREYLKDNEKPPTIAGLAYWLGVDRLTIYNYEKRLPFFNTIKKAREWVLSSYEESAADGKGGGGVIFLMKNYGYTDKQELDIKSTEIKVRIDADD